MLLLIGSCLNLSGHVGNICKKSSQRVGVINRLTNLIPQNAKSQLFKGASLPHLTRLCSTVWNFKKGHLEPFIVIVIQPILNCFEGQNYPLYMTESYRT